MSVDDFMDMHQRPPVGTFADGDKVVSVFTNMHGDTWVYLLRDGREVVIGSDIDWEPIDRLTILAAEEQLWVIANRMVAGTQHLTLD